MITKVCYKGKEVALNDITITWTDRLGETLTGSIEQYASDYANECVAEVEAGEDW